MSVIDVKTHTQYKYCQKYNPKINYRNVFHVEDKNLMADIKEGIFKEHTYNHLMRGKCLPHSGPTFDAYIEEKFPSGEFSFKQLCQSMFPDDSPEPNTEYESVRDYLINGRDMAEESVDLMLHNQNILHIGGEFEVENKDFEITLSIGEEYGNEQPTFKVRGDQIRSTGYICSKLYYFGYLVRQYYTMDEECVRGVRLTADAELDVIVVFTRYVNIKGTPIEVVCAVTGRQAYGALFGYDSQTYSPWFSKPLYNSVKGYLLETGIGENKVDAQLANQALLTIKEADPENEDIELNFPISRSSTMEECILTAEQISYMGTAEWTLYGEDDYKIKYYQAGNSGISFNYVTETRETSTDKLIKSYKRTIAFDVLIVKTKEANIRGVLCEVLVNVTGFRFDDHLYQSYRIAYGNPVDEETYQLKTDIISWIQAQKEKKPLESRVCKEDDLPF